MFPYDPTDEITAHNRRVSRVNCIAWMKQSLTSGQSLAQRIRSRFRRG